MDLCVFFPSFQTISAAQSTPGKLTCTSLATRLYFVGSWTVRYLCVLAWFCILINLWSSNFHPNENAPVLMNLYSC